MALTKRQQEALDTLRLSMGGGFNNYTSCLQKMDTTDDKFLFVGLGGQGAKIIAELKTGIYRNINCNPKTKKPDNVEYLAIDTATEDLDYLCIQKLTNIPIDKTLETCQLFSGNSAAVLETPELIPDYIKEWKNENLHATLTGNGTAGIRQAAKYLLYSQDGYTRVHDQLFAKISSLGAKCHGSERLIIYLFAGLGGGTGSGCFIDVAYIIRNIVNNLGYTNHLKLEGYVYLPDSYSKELPAPTISLIKSNSTAALKELDYYMNANDMDVYYDATFPGDVKIHSNADIFNTCTLVTGSIAGGGLTAHPDKFSKQVVVDFILNLIKKSNLDENVFLIDSFLDNSQVSITNAVNTLPDTVPRNAIYKYNVIGIGAMTLPLEQLLSYIANQTFDRIKVQWDNQPVSADIDNLLQVIKIYTDKQYGNIVARLDPSFLPYTKKMVRATKEEVKNGTAKSKVKSIWMKRNIPLLHSLNLGVLAVITEILDLLNQKLVEMLMDSEKGLFYTRDLVGHVAADAGDFNGLVERLRTDLIADIDGFLNGCVASQQAIMNQMNILVKELDKFHPFGVNVIIEDYIKECVNYYVEDSKKEVLTRIKKNIKQVKDYLENRLALYEAFADSFEYLHDVFADNLQVIAKNDNTSDYHIELFNITKTEDPQTQNIINYLDGLLGEKNITELTHNLAKTILTSEEKFKEESYNPMEVYTEYVETEFANVVNNSVETLIETKYGDGNFNNGVLEICQELQHKSKVIFDPNPSFPLGSMFSTKYIAAPAIATNLITQIQAFAGVNNIKVAQSIDKNSIYWYNLISGVPLFAIAKIQEYEEKYEEVSIHTIGLHSHESREGKNWREYPSLSNYAYWDGAGYCNQKEVKLVARVNENAKKMLQYGILQNHGTEADPDYVCYLLKRLDYTREELEQFISDYKVNGVKVDDKLDIGKGMFNAFAEKFGAIKKSLYLTTIYEKRDFAAVCRLLRMNWDLYLLLEKQIPLMRSLADELVKENKSKIFYIGSFYYMPEPFILTGFGASVVTSKYEIINKAHGVFPRDIILGNGSDIVIIQNSRLNELVCRTRFFDPYISSDRKASFTQMLGAVCGDVAGSVYEHHNIKYVPDTKTLIQHRARFTDDSVMTLAVAVGIQKALKRLGKFSGFTEADEPVLLEELRTSVHQYGNRYPRAGYGGSFRRWLASNDMEPYNSWGNGSAMRVSYAGWFSRSLKDAEFLAAASAKITHNHPEGIKGAKAIAGSIHLSLEKSPEDAKKEVLAYASSMYDMNFTLNEIRDTYHFDVSCQGSVPQAIRAFIEGNSFEEVIALAISIGGDSDTIAAMAGSIAECVYPIPEGIRNRVLDRLDNSFKSELAGAIDYLMDTVNNLSTSGRIIG